MRSNMQDASPWQEHQADDQQLGTFDVFAGSGRQIEWRIAVSKGIALAIFVILVIGSGIVWFMSRDGIEQDQQPGQEVPQRLAPAQ